MDEQFVNELAVALRKVGTIHTVGEEWVSYIGEIPVGGVPYCGQMCTRATYSALWSYAQEKGLVKTEAEWQQIATANNGNVPFYSSGDGSSTFRMPSIKGYVKGASSQSVAGDYIAEGLPNIEGNLTTENASDYNFISDASMGQIGESGAFYISQWTNKYVTSKGGTSLYSPVALDFDASYSNPIYGASDHVTPETSTVLFGVYAFGAIVESGELDATTLQTGLARVESSLGGYLPLSGGNVTGNLTVQSKNVLRSVNGLTADASGNVPFTIGQCAPANSYSGVDLNDMTEAGVFFVNNGSADLNYPSGSNGILVVYKAEYSSGGGHMRQIFYRYGTVGTNDHNHFTRSATYTDGAWVWGPWHKDVSLLSYWQSGTNWTRVDSHLFCEQGGIIGGTGEITVTLHTPMRDTNYSVLVSYNNTNNGSNNVTPNEISAYSKTTTSFKVYGDFASKCWRVSGFVSGY